MDELKRKLKEKVINLFLISTMFIIILIISYTLGYNFGVLEYKDVLTDPLGWCDNLKNEHPLKTSNNITYPIFNLTSLI